MTHQHHGFLVEWRARRHLLSERIPMGPDPLAEWGAPHLSPHEPRPNRTGVRDPSLPGTALVYTDQRLRALGVMVTGLELAHLLEFLNDHAELCIGGAIARAIPADVTEQHWAEASGDERLELLAARSIDALAIRAEVLQTLDAEITAAAPTLMYEAWRRPFAGYA